MQPLTLTLEWVVLLLRGRSRGWWSAVGMVHPDVLALESRPNLAMLLNVLCLLRAKTNVEGALVGVQSSILDGEHPSILIAVIVMAMPPPYNISTTLASGSHKRAPLNEFFHFAACALLAKWGIIPN